MAAVRWSWFWVYASLLLSCAEGVPTGEVPPPTAASSPRAAVGEKAEPAPVTCAKRLGKDGGYHEFNVARGLELEPKDGEPVDPVKVLAAYEKAAELGHIGAQLELGWRRFEALRTDDTLAPEQRDATILALVDVFGAGFRGLRAARERFPDMKLILDRQELPTTLQQPLDAVPREWVQEALRIAIACKEPPPDRVSFAPTMNISIALPSDMKGRLEQRAWPDGKGGSEYMPTLSVARRGSKHVDSRNWLTIEQSYPFRGTKKPRNLDEEVERPGGSWLFYGTREQTSRRSSNCRVSAWHAPSQTYCRSAGTCDDIPLGVAICLSVQAEGKPLKPRPETAETFTKGWLGKKLDVDGARPVALALARAIMSNDRAAFEAVSAPTLRVDGRRRSVAKLKGKDLATALKIGCAVDERRDHKESTPYSTLPPCEWAGYVVSETQVELNPWRPGGSMDGEDVRRFTLQRQDGEWRLTRVDTFDRQPRDEADAYKK